MEKKDSRFIYPLELIKSSFNLENQNSKKVFSSPQMRCLQVYCIQSVSGKWLPLNRDYKPLGLTRQGWVEYESYSHLFIPEDMINFDVLWDNGSAFGRNGFYLFTDSTTPINLKDQRRYEDIASVAFFGIKHELDFKKLWEYRKGMNLDEWERNIKRFEKI